MGVEREQRRAEAEPAFLGLFGELFHSIKAPFTWSALYFKHSEGYRTVWHDKSPLNDLLIVTMIVNFLGELAAEAQALNQDLQNPSLMDLKAQIIFF